MKTAGLEKDLRKKKRKTPGELKHVSRGVFYSDNQRDLRCRVPVASARSDRTYIEIEDAKDDL